MRFRGRPVLGVIFGFLFFFFIAADLLFFGVVPLDSAVLTILPLIGIVAGLLWAYWAPLGRRSATAPPPVPPPDAGPPPEAEPPATEPV